MVYIVREWEFKVRRRRRRRRTAAGGGGADKDWGGCWGTCITITTMGGYAVLEGGTINRGLMNQ